MWVFQTITFRPCPVSRRYARTLRLLAFLVMIEAALSQHQNTFIGKDNAQGNLQVEKEFLGTLNQKTSRRKREVTDQPIQDFLEALKTDPVDLIILIERTRAVSRFYFYQEARPFISYVLRYYAHIGPSNVRLVLATFAADVTVHLDTISNANIQKCSLWKTYWPEVFFIDTPHIWNRTDVRTAYEKALMIFNTRGKPGRNRYMWVLTSGDYKISQDGDPEPIKAQLEAADVTIVTSKIGNINGLEGNIRIISTSSSHYGGNITMWANTSTKVEPLQQIPKIEESVDSSIFQPCFCDVTMGFEYCKICYTCPCISNMEDEDCVCPNTSTSPKTLCKSRALPPTHACDYRSGRTGRTCNMNVTQCIENTCANEGTCVEQGNHYTCKCLQDWNPAFYCQTSLTTTTTTAASAPVAPPGVATVVPPVVIYAAAAGGGVLLIIILICICCIACKRRRDTSTRTPAVETATQETYTSSDIILQTGQVGYSEIENDGVTERRPTAIIRPHLNKLKRWSQRVPSMFRQIPPPLLPANGRAEITMSVSSVKTDGYDVFADKEDIYNKEDYENAGHQGEGMEVWLNFTTQLLTTGGFKQFAIIRYDRVTYASTSTAWFLPTKKEMKVIYDIFRSGEADSTFNIRRAQYRVVRNDSRMIESQLVSRTPESLCIGRSKQFLVLGLMGDTINSSVCFSKVKEIRDDLSQQGK